MTTQAGASGNYNDGLLKYMGIGTTNPIYQLDVEGSWPIANGILVKNNDATANSRPAEIYFGSTAVSSSLKAAVGMDYASRNFFVWVNGSDRLNITTGGNVGIGTTSPNSSLQINGGFAPKRTAVVNSNYSTSNDTIIGVTGSTFKPSISISPSDVVAGRIMIIKDEGGYAKTNNITIEPNGATIDGWSSNIVMSTNYGVLRLYSDGNNWFTF